MVDCVYLPHKCIAFVLEHAYLLNGAVRRECLLQYLLVEEAREGAVDAATINGAVGGAALVVHLVKGQRFYVDCEWVNVRDNIENVLVCTLTVCLGGRRFSCCPICAYGTRAEPLAVHGIDGGFRFLQSAKLNGKQLAKMLSAICHSLSSRLSRLQPELPARLQVKTSTNSSESVEEKTIAFVEKLLLAASDIVAWPPFDSGFLSLIQAPP